MNKTFSLLLLLATTGCTTNNYWQCHNPTPAPAPGAHAMPPQSQAPHPAGAATSQLDSKYDRSAVQPGAHLMPPPAGATALSGEMDPLHFPHFCGPGARQHDAC